ncbi:MAG: recombination protein RecR [Candidatus Doudnabacteria bacterium]|nr:recombination protein RecR [Candidatus Doudnabacteria bacterium]
MTKLPTSLQRLINELSKLPGVGHKTAQRLAFYLLKRDNIDNTFLSQSIGNLSQGVMFCSICHNMVETDPCSTCTDPNRDVSVLCVVEEPLDALAIDKTGHFKGLFHVLGGVLNPLEGIGPEKLNVDSLVKRISPSSSSSPLRGEGDAIKVKEIIIATNPSLEGEATAMHLSKVIKQSNPLIKITRIARGLPMGGDLEYADDITLMRALEGRREY